MTYLSGAGHFACGFLIGALLMQLSQFTWRKSLSVQLYAPFLMFAVGGWAAIPYLWLPAGDCLHSRWYNFFVFYELLHCQPIAVSVLGRLNIVALVCASVYAIVILKYIGLVTRCNKYGWPILKDSKHA